MPTTIDFPPSSRSVTDIFVCSLHFVLRNPFRLLHHDEERLVTTFVGVLYICTYCGRVLNLYLIDSLLIIIDCFSSGKVLGFSFLFLPKFASSKVREMIGSETFGVFLLEDKDKG